MKVKALTVGPILGATTADSARIWGRGEYKAKATGPRRACGVARIRPAGSARYRQPIFFKLNPNFDMTGVAMFTNLEAERAYEYQVGWFYSKRELDEFTPELSLKWRDIPKFTFHTGATNQTEARAFIFGSCRYLLRLFGGSWFDNRGDKTFRSILRQIDAGHATDLMLMIGDQIYADDLNVVMADQTSDEYLARYRDAFSQPYIRELMSRVPTYMTLDDHEIQDAWPKGASGHDFMVKYPAAMHAYQTYQASHSPLLPMPDANRMVGVPQKLWYTFNDGCCDFFVTDTRTERLLSDDPTARQIMSVQQLAALKAWLRDGMARVKFVVSSAPFFPDPIPTDAREDKWSGFVSQRDEILNVIHRNGLQRIVFLGGDYHASMQAELISPNVPGFRILSVVSSAFYWPYRHGSARKYQLNGALETMSNDTYEVVNSSPVHSTDNFTRVTADMDRLKIEVYGRKGDLLATNEYAF